MEKFSNKYSELHNRLKVELSTLDLALNEKCVVKYLEMPWFSGRQFSLCLVKNNSNQTYKLIEKMWDNKFDSDRFSTGIFNLDRLCVRTRAILISREKQEEYEKIIQNIPFIPETLERQNYIILDGIEYELTINIGMIDKNYKWKLATDDYKYFEPLITFIKAME